MLQLPLQSLLSMKRNRKFVFETKQNTFQEKFALNLMSGVTMLFDM